MSLAAMIRRKNKNATFSLDKMQQRASVDFVTRLDKATQIGASFNYDLAQGESNAILVASAHPGLPKELQAVVH